jgi:hypothetical protein
VAARRRQSCALRASGRLVVAKHVPCGNPRPLKCHHPPFLFLAVGALVVVCTTLPAWSRDIMEQALLWLIWRGVEMRAREKWHVDAATDKANAAFEALMLEEEKEVWSLSRLFRFRAFLHEQGLHAAHDCLCLDCPWACVCVVGGVWMGVVSAASPACPRVALCRIARRSGCFFGELWQ